MRKELKEDRENMSQKQQPDKPGKRFGDKLIEEFESNGLAVVEDLGEYASKCPYCHKTIYMPKYRVNPIPIELMKERVQKRLTIIKKIAQNE